MNTLASEQRTLIYCNYFLFRAKVSASRVADNILREHIVYE